MALIDCEMNRDRFAGTGRELLTRGLAIRSAMLAAETPAVAAGALRASGLLALLLSPALLIASLWAEAPVAVPALLALGFLPVARSVALGRSRQAAGWMVAIGIAMVGCSLAIATLLEPRAGIAASALVAVLCAAPAVLARGGRRPAAHRGEATPDKGNEAVEDGGPASPLPLVPALGEQEAPVIPPPGIFRETHPDAAVHPVTVAEAAPEAPTVANPVADAVDFALRLVGPDAGRRRVDLHAEGDMDALVAVSRQDLRIVVHRSLAALAAAAVPATHIHLVVKPTRGAVLLRFTRDETPSATSEATAPFWSEDMNPVAHLVATTGGTLLWDQAPGGRVTISIRLPRVIAAGPAAPAAGTAVA